MKKIALKQNIKYYKFCLIVFVSKKAYESFVRVAQAEGATALLSKAKSVPHPNSAWWNRSITQYEGRSGKEEMRRILSDNR